MRILIESPHRYPAAVGGLSGHCVSDALAKGLGELGHEVYYFLSGGSALPMPPGVNLVSSPLWEVDVVHVSSIGWVGNEAKARGKPWVHTKHVDVATQGMDREQARGNWIFVSQYLAGVYGSNRYVLNGIDPSEFIFSDVKEDYFLFVQGGSLAYSRTKGMDIAMDLAAKQGVRLVVAGGSPDADLVRHYAELCRQRRVEYVGQVWGTAKAKLFAGARALLHPTRLPESFGLVIAESLMSGTPVICSNMGSCPELVKSNVGFVCKDEPDYLNAIANIDTISPTACRDLAMSDYHYSRMAEGYVDQYRLEIARSCTRSLPEHSPLKR